MSQSFKPPKRKTPVRLGEILVKSGQLNPKDLTQALDIQYNCEARLGDILIAHSFSTQDAVNDAIHAQIREEPQSIAQLPPDIELLNGLDPQTCIRLQAVPWQRVGNTLLVAAADVTKLDAISRVFSGRIALFRASQDSINDCICSVFKSQLKKSALNACPEPYSCRNLNLTPKKLTTAALIGGLIGLGAANVEMSFVLLFCWALLSNLMTTGLRALSLLSFLKHRKTRSVDSNISRISDHIKRPRVSILVPLFREEKVLPALIQALTALTYPKELLDVKLLLEENDTLTQNAFKKLALPHWASVIIAPADRIQTKPRAMNYALPFCTGSLIGIYDAEDRPDPDQIDKIVAHFMKAPPKVVAVQCNLDFYNTRDNWLSRCFTIEYSSWFRVIMRGMEKLRLPLPLGGTSVFMRRWALEQVGGWDAHNVTEDADLGMRLARMGYRCEMVDSTTWEEANKVRVGWVKQRSRWIKGFIITWLTQMRHPVSLLGELGLPGFIGLQIVLLGTATAFLLAPVFWVMWLGAFGVEWSFYSLMPSWFWASAIIGLLLSEGVMILISALAIHKKRSYTLLPYILTMPLYWPLGTLAAYKALYEIFTDPFYWDKTTHGLE
jgi:cellulose synthase/poly-beta-1,6-N-acetylglucosamine synthase-like glycosyltransferase